MLQPTGQRFYALLYGMFLNILRLKCFLLTIFVTALLSPASLLSEQPAAVVTDPPPGNAIFELEFPQLLINAGHLGCRLNARGRSVPRLVRGKNSIALRGILRNRTQRARSRGAPPHRITKIRQTVRHRLNIPQHRTLCEAALSEPDSFIAPLPKPDIPSSPEPDETICEVADFNGSGSVGKHDLFYLLKEWGKSGSSADLNSNGVVGLKDLKILIALWGPVSECNFAPPSDFSILVPGAGFTGPTPDPDPVGDIGEPGYDAKAIARWDVVPHQTFSGDFHIGVVAFHINGIDRVAFSVEGGPWTSVYHKQHNPRTGVYEYTTILRAKAFAEGPIEIRAVVFPKAAGVPRVLAGDEESSVNGEHSLYLNADPDGLILANREVRWVSPTGNNVTGNGTEASPFASIRHAARQINTAQGGNADNGLIYLMEGDHPWAGDSDGWQNPITEHAWITIAPAPGANPDNVVIETGTGDRLNAALVHISGVTVRRNLQSSFNLNRLPKIWFDGVTLEGSGPTDNINFVSHTAWLGGIYTTDTILRNVRNGHKGGTRLERNAVRENLGEDAFFNAPLIINGFVDGIDTSGVPGGPHPDVVQYHGVRHNNILYGLHAVNCKAQGVFMRSSSNTPSSDIAFVNVLVEMAPDAYLNQILNPVNHLLLWNMTLANRPLRISNDPSGQTDPTILNNLSMKNNVFFDAWSFESSIGYNSTVSNNHFIQGTSAGNNYTTGEALFKNAANADYRPGDGSPLLARIDEESAVVPADALNRPLNFPAAIGALQP